MVMAGLEQPRISVVLNLDPKTLRKHFREELDLGKDQASANVVLNLYRQAVRNDFRAIPAAIYWTKAQLGWSDRQTIAHTGPNGGPIQMLQIDPARLADMNDAELAALESAIGKLQRGPDAGPSGATAPADEHEYSTTIGGNK